VQCAFGDEGGELFLSSKKPVIFVRTLHNLLEGAGRAQQQIEQQKVEAEWGQQQLGPEYVFHYGSEG
jgi:hypothetical protein